MINLNSLYLNLNKWDEGGVIQNININNNTNIITVDCEGPEYYNYKIFIKLFEWFDNINIISDYDLGIKDYNIIITPIN